MLRSLSLALCWLLLLPTLSPAADYVISASELQRIEQSLSAQRRELAGLRLSLSEQSETSASLRQRLERATQNLLESERHIAELSRSLQRASLMSEALKTRLQQVLSESTELTRQLRILQQSFSQYESEALAALRSARRRGILYAAGAFLLGLGTGALLVN